MTSHTSPGLLSVHELERSSDSPCRPQRAYFRLLKGKCTKIALRFVGTLAVGAPVGSALSKHKVT